MFIYLILGFSFWNGYDNIYFKDLLLDNICGRILKMMKFFLKVRDNENFFLRIFMD